MKSKILNQLLLLTILCASFSNSKADNTPQAPGSLPTTATQPTSDAISLASQAGSIAGAAASCGQDTSLLTQRVGEIILGIVKTPAEKVYAEQAYRNSMITSQVQQNNNPKFPCNQVLQDYNNLPILRSDYKQSVLPNVTAAPGATAQPNNTTAPQTITAPAAPTLPPAPTAAAGPSGMNAILPASNNNMASSSNVNVNMATQNQIMGNANPVAQVAPPNPTPMQPTASNTVQQQYVTATPAPAPAQQPVSGGFNP